MRFNLLMLVGILFPCAAASAQELAEAPRKQLESFLQDNFFKESMRIDPAKTRFNPKSNVLFVTAEVLTANGQLEVGRAILKSDWKNIEFKDDKGTVIVSVPLDADKRKAGFTRSKSKKGDQVEFTLKLGKVDISKVKEVVGSK